MLRIFSVLTALTLTACGVSDGPEAIDSSSANPMAAELAAPARSLTMTTTPARPGSQFTATVSGAAPNKRVYLRVSVAGTGLGGGTCPPNLGGICFDILEPTVALGSAIANGAGVATIRLVLNASYDGRSGWLQASQPNAAASSTSNTVFVLINRDTDGDGVGALEGDCNDTNAAIKPGATELPGDSVDQNCDGSELCYVDGDGDGYGSSTTTTSGSLSCAPAGVSLTNSDCDDGNSSVSPGALEVCDGNDNNCNGFIDTDAWWDTDWSYRVPVQVTTSADWFSEGAPVAVEIDFDAILRAQGDTSGLAANSVRVVHQDCSRGLPEMPSEFADGISGLFDGVDIVDPANDDYGTVLWLFDRDGDYTALDVVRPGLLLTYSIYFGSNATTGAMSDPNYPTSQVATSNGTTSVLANTESDATFQRTSGGLATRLGRVGRPNVGAQTSSAVGNGIYLGTTGAGSWVSALTDTTASMELVHSGPMLGAVRSSGSVSNAYGGFDYEYIYFQIEGRPEIYAKVTYTLDRTSNIGPQNPFFGSAVRPWMLNNNGLLAAGTNEGAGGIPDYEWARSTFDVNGVAPYGIAMGWRRSAVLRSRPIFDDATSATPGRYLGLAGQDLQSTFVTGQTSFSGTAGQDVLDHAILAIYPHAGKFGSVSNDFFATLDGPSSVVFPVQVLP